MTRRLTNGEKAEIESIAKGISYVNIAEGLRALLEREKIILEESDMGEGEAREITLHNMTLLIAAISRIMDFVDAEDEIKAEINGRIS
jgi:hypothetical protein